MQIVIDIPDEQFITLNAKTQKEVISVIDHKLLINAIQNGIPLPKGHGALIDINNIESIMLEDSLDRMVHIKGDEVDWYIEAPIIVEAYK